MLAGVVEQFILRTKEFSDYTKYSVGVDAENYINAGILVIDLDKFRKQRIEEKFSYLINKYNFDVINNCKCGRYNVISVDTEVNK